jgi:hypothetical protein
MDRHKKYIPARLVHVHAVGLAEAINLIMGKCQRQTRGTPHVDRLMPKQRLNWQITNARTPRAPHTYQPPPTWLCSSSVRAVDSSSLVASSSLCKTVEEGTSGFANHGVWGLHVPTRVAHTCVSSAAWAPSAAAARASATTARASMALRCTHAEHLQCQVHADADAHTHGHHLTSRLTTPLFFTAVPT